MKTLATAVLLISTLASGQTSKSATAAPKAPRPQVIQFGESDVIDGVRLSADVDFIVAPSHPGFRNLIKIRSDFSDKLLASVNEL